MQLVRSPLSFQTRARFWGPDHRPRLSTQRPGRIPLLAALGDPAITAVVPVRCTKYDRSRQDGTKRRLTQYSKCMPNGADIDDTVDALTPAVIAVARRRWKSAVTVANHERGL